MTRRLAKPVMLVMVVVLTFAAIPALAGPVPSKTVDNQSLDSRDADLAVIREVAADRQVTAVLIANGLTPDQVQQRLEQMSPQDLHQLAQNLEQLEPAGQMSRRGVWILVGALAALLLIIALAD